MINEKNRYQETKNGFSLLELLLSIALIALIASVFAPVYLSFHTRNNVDIASTTVVSALRRAQSLSKAIDSDSTWGVYIQSNNITVFRGSSYASRDSNFDENNNIPGGVTPSGLQEIVFSKLKGETSSTGNIELTSANNEVRTISINEKGTVSY